MNFLLFLCPLFETKNPLLYMDVSRLDGEMGLFWQGHTHPCVRMFSVTQDIIGVAYGMWFVELGFFLCCM